MTPLRAFVLDDEAPAVRRMVRLLEASGRVEVVGSSTDPRAALERLTDEERVDLVFLDVQMPELDGFAFARALTERLGPSAAPHLVFATAHDEHALAAFRAAAVDFLVKPVREADLVATLDKLDRLLRRGDPDALRGALEALLAQAALAATRCAPPARIASRTGRHVELLDVSRVTHVMAEDRLVYAFVAGKGRVVDESLVDLERRLGSAFLRIHRNVLVRLDAIEELSAEGNGTATVRVGDEARSELPVSRERLRALKDALGLP